jgi:hypothetical protein
MFQDFHSTSKLYYKCMPLFVLKDFLGSVLSLPNFTLLG